MHQGCSRGGRALNAKASKPLISRPPSKPFFRRVNSTTCRMAGKTICGIGSPDPSLRRLAAVSGGLMQVLEIIECAVMRRCVVWNPHTPVGASAALGAHRERRCRRKEAACRHFHNRDASTR